MKLRKKIKGAISFILTAATLFIMPITAAAQVGNEGFDSPDGASVEPRIERSEWKYSFPDDAGRVNITLDGKRILDGEAAILDSATYVPLRSYAEICKADSIEWNALTKTASIKKNNVTIKVSPGLNYIEAAGRYFYFNTPVRNIDDRLFVPIRPISTALSVNVGWDPYTRTAVLTSAKNGLASADAFYNSDDLYWLSRIINAESGGEPLIGKIAVGNVVLNRKASSAYPNTIYGVIFDRKHGTQFTPAVTGTIYKKPSAESIIAAKICLEGYSVDGRVLFFMNPKIATNNWISKNRPFAFRIGNHNFYY